MVEQLLGTHTVWSAGMNYVIVHSVFSCVIKEVAIYNYISVIIIISSFYYVALSFWLLDVFPANQLYIMFSAENSGAQLGSYVVSSELVQLYYVLDRKYTAIRLHVEHGVTHLGHN